MSEREKKFMKNIKPKYTSISLYVIFTVFIIYILLKAVDNLPGIMLSLGTGIKWLNVLLKPLFFGFAISYLLYPLSGFLEKNLDKLKAKLHKQNQRPPKSSRGLAVLLTVLIIIGILFLGFSIIISTVTNELTVFTAKDIETLITTFTDTLQSLAGTISRGLNHLNISSAELEAWMTSVGNYVSNYLQTSASDIFASAKNITGGLSTFLFSIIFGIYFLLDGNGLMHYWDHVLDAFTNKKTYNRIHTFINDADTVFSGYIRGQFLDALFMAIMVSVCLSLAGVKYAVIIGILTGIGNLIPYVGPFVAYISTLLVSLLDWNLNRVIAAVIILLIIQAIDGNIINPKLLSSNIDIHPMLVIAALIIGSAIGGIAGMLMAVPCAGLLKIYFEKLVEFMKNRRIEQDSPSHDI